MKKRVSPQDIIFSKESVIDPFGRVFYYNDEVYRLIPKNATYRCKELLTSGVLDELTDAGFIPKTTIEDQFTIEDGCLILHHEKCEITKPYEWSFEMFKSAAIHILKVNKICNKYGYELKDGHPYNVTFHQGKPIFFDIGSIEKKGEGEWKGKEEYIETVLLPLLLWQDGDYFFLRTFLETPDCYYRRVQPYQSPLSTPYLRGKVSALFYYEIIRGEFKIKTQKSNIVKVYYHINKLVVFLRGKRNYNFFKIKKGICCPTEEYVSSINHQIKETAWADYQPKLDLPEIKLEFPRYFNIIELINEYCGDAQTVLDLAGNGGAFTRLLEQTKQFHQLLVGDYDENAINNGFLYFQNHDLPITTVWMNCMLPCEYDDTVERLKSDLVIGLAITHHLILSQKFSLDFIFERFKSYTKKYVAIEFMPKGLWGGVGAFPDTPEWYSEEWFSHTFSKYFNILHIEQLEVNRILFLGSIKK